MENLSNFSTNKKEDSPKEIAHGLIARNLIPDAFEKLLGGYPNSSLLIKLKDDYDKEILKKWT